MATGSDIEIETGFLGWAGGLGAVAGPNGGAGAAVAIGENGGGAGGVEPAFAVESTGPGGVVSACEDAFGGLCAVNRRRKEPDFG